MLAIDLFCYSYVIYFQFFFVKITDGIQSYFKRILEEFGGTLFATNIFHRQISRGTIRLLSTDPFDPPLVDPNYLDHPDDITNFLKGN